MILLVYVTVIVGALGAVSDPIIAAFPPRIIAEIPPRSLSFISWINVGSQSTWTSSTLLALQSPTDPVRTLAALTLFDDTRLSVDVTTQMGFESIPTPAHIWLNEWVLVALSITSGQGRNVTTHIALPDGSYHTASEPLSSDMIHANATLLMAGGAHAYMTSFQALDRALSRDDVISFYQKSAPNQRFMSALSVGGQVFGDSPSLTIRCMNPKTVIAEIAFSSYGRPLGVYPNFLINPACHAVDSVAYVTKLCLGKASCIVAADHDRLGDPCPHWRKNLAVVAKCIDADWVAPAPFVFRACNVSLVVQARNASVADFGPFFAATSNISEDRVPLATLQPLSATLQVLTFTILPDGKRSARQIAENFDASMQSVQSPYRSGSLLKDAAKPPLGVRISDLELAQCGPGQYVARPGTCGPSGDMKSSSSGFGAQLGAPVSVMALFGTVVAAAVAFWCCSRRPVRQNPTIDVPVDSEQQPKAALSKGTLASGHSGSAGPARSRGRTDAVSIQMLTPPRSLRSGAASRFVMRSTDVTSMPGSQRSLPMTVSIESGPTHVSSMSESHR